MQPERRTIVTFRKYTPDEFKMLKSRSKIKKKKKYKIRIGKGASLVVQWLRIHLPMQAFEGFPGGSVVKNPPATAGDTGSISDPGRSHIPRSNKARGRQLLSLCSRAREPQLLSPRACAAEACVLKRHHREKPALRSCRAAPTHHSQRKARAA